MNRSLAESLKLYFVMGSKNCKQAPEKVLEQAILGGITLFQFREKGGLDGTEKYELAKQFQQICNKHQVPFIVNDDVMLALELDADGVHIGQEDDPIEQTRARIGDKILGVSAHNLEEAKQAVEYGADYLGVGPMYETSTKNDTREVNGPAVIENIKKSGIRLPIVGIGGITPGRVAPVIKAGANGVAVISSISKATNIEEATQTLLKETQVNSSSS